MSYMIALMPCVCCQQMFSANPDKVPSVRVNGIREGVCKACMDRANTVRKEIGMAELTYAADAYEAEQVDY